MKEAEKRYPIYFLYGVEDYLIEEEIKALTDLTLSTQEKSLNLHVFNGEEQVCQEILQAARTLPMFSKYRFVLVQKADQMKEEEVEGLVNYLQKPSPSTCLVLRSQETGPWKKQVVNKYSLFLLSGLFQAALCQALPVQAASLPGPLCQNHPSPGI